MKFFTITMTHISPNATMIKTVQEWAGHGRQNQFEAFEKIVNAEKEIAPCKVYPRYDSTCINFLNGGKSIVTLHEAAIED